MRIDGRDATTGTLVVSADQEGVIDLPWGSFKLVFNPVKSPANVSLNLQDMQIVFDGTDNPLGTAASLQIPLTSGKSEELNIAVYSIGEGKNATRVLHYSVG